MEPRWTVLRADPYDAQQEFGPGGDSLPKAFGAAVQYNQLGIHAELSGAFDGEQLVVSHFTITGAPVTPRLLSALTLTAVVHEVGTRLLVPGPFGRFRERPRPNHVQLRTEMQRVATAYWREYATWGEPTHEIQRIWSIPGSTANHWVKRAHTLYGLPGR